MNRLDIFDRARSGITPPPEHKEKGNKNLGYILDKLAGSLIRDGSSSLIKVEHSIPKMSVHGSVVLNDADVFNIHLLTVLLQQHSGILSRNFSAGDLLFFDIETTGLSGGAGTNVFLIGLLHITDNDIQIIQYFLNNLSSERLFLELLNNHFSRGAVLVSYNGKGFDYNVIKSRCILNSLPFGELNPLHLDLLFTSRRIWKGMFPDFSLKTVERMALGFDRYRDIPGFRIPEVYFDYLKGRDAAEDLYAVFLHNKNDVLSLLALLIKQLALVKSGLEIRNREKNRYDELFNPASLSDMLIKSNYNDEAKSLLYCHIEDTEALKRLGLLCKKQKHTDDALRFFKLITERTEGLLDYIFACTEIAKLYEHVLRDIECALSYTEKARERLKRSSHFYHESNSLFEKERVLIEKRFHRLQKKLSSVKHC